MAAARLTRRLTDYALGLIAWLIGSFHDEWTYRRRRFVCWRDDHKWVCMTDAHCCSVCGQWNGVRACVACGLWL